MTYLITAPRAYRYRYFDQCMDTLDEISAALDQAQDDLREIERGLASAESNIRSVPAQLGWCTFFAVEMAVILFFIAVVTP